MKKLEPVNGKMKFLFINFTATKIKRYEWKAARVKKYDDIHIKTAT